MALDRGVVAHLRRVSGEPDLSATKYRLLGLLGQGGMGEVYIAEDRELDRTVALKVTSGPTAMTDDLADRLRREARIVARLEHPGIVPVHDVGVLPDGRAYYVMKLVRGKQLDVWLDDAPARAAVLRLFQRICEAVAFAHAGGVIHRDLKPQNIMVGAFGEALVMDWGLAKPLHAQVSVQVAEAGISDPGAVDLADDTLPTAAPTQVGAVLGTPAYMSPEQARGEVHDLDERTDVYALGAILYYVLACRAPFEGSSSAQVIERVIASEPAPLDGTVARPLASICSKAMQKTRTDRYQSAAAMADDVARFLDGSPVSAHRETVAERVGRVAIKYQVLLILLAAYVVMRGVLLLVGRL